ncbi:epoxyqueuosine reductase [Geomonas sp. Red32]|uniref:epoxyqueuosine reductase n=1 Tax=Geomonas sp. Red32 TaxID=2912856 RepID=UPI00202CDFD0|nr:epoxyqueuosine reductase [Geomonas sp. Red32]MCM0080430.1 epoxyqueuosine reductase [Geomonas sp. Red32]
MRELICGEIRRFVRDDAGNRFPDGQAPYFDEPLVGFTAAADPLFTEYKTVIGDFHFTPAELAERLPEDGGWEPKTVITWVLPITAATRETNRREERFPSRAWAQTRNFGEAFNGALRRHLVAFLTARGHRAFAPQFHPAWKEYADTPVGVASSWSERHAAYAAGLGTFSLNDAVITPRGIAHRLGSVVTDLELEPSARPYPNHTHNCLYYRNGTCGACITRCPVGALNKDGHDKNICGQHVYGTAPEAVAKEYGVTATGCGLCQTKVPCESRIP